LKRSLVFLTILSAAAYAQATNPAMVDVPDTPGLPRVLLIGDSISIGYTIPVRELLQGKANVHRIPANGGPTSFGVANLDAWLGNGHWDVIHFNFGLHDLKIMPGGSRQVSLADYERNLSQIVERLRKTSAVLIWASTTPVPEGHVSPPRVTSDVLAYNVVAKRVMQSNGIPIDNLYALAAAHLSTWQLPHNVHYTKPGYQGLAESVAGWIEKALPKK
jgi:acyl-CoA thioesterase-1